LLVQYWDPDKAQGFFHEFSGWVIFVVSLVMLFLLIVACSGCGRKEPRAHEIPDPFHRRARFAGRHRTVSGRRANRGEVFPARLPLASFPQQLGSWTGTDVEIEKEIRDVLAPATSCCASTATTRLACPATICSSPISPASAPATPFIRQELPARCRMDAH